MDPKQLRALFAIADEVKDEDLLEAVTKAKAALDEKLAELTAKVEAKSEPKPDDKKPDEKPDEKPDDNADKPVAIAASELASLRANAQKTYRENAQHRIDTMLREGRISPAMAKTFDLGKHRIQLSENADGPEVERLLTSWAANKPGTFPVPNARRTLSQHDGTGPGAATDIAALTAEMSKEAAAQKAPAL